MGGAIGPRAAVRVTRALHCNLNVRRLATAAAVYEGGLGLQTRMRSRSEGADSTPLGIAGPTDSEVWFLYDHRGGRVGPAIELVEWTSPRTTGEAYAHQADVGMHALGFAVPSATSVRAALVGAGARAVDRKSGGVDSVVVDADDVSIELVGDPGVPAPTFAYARLNCADLEATTQWYAAIGLQRVGPVETETWGGTDLAGGCADVPVQRLSFGDDSSFELRLMTWPGTDPDARAHARANQRGLYRMALAVDDVREAVTGAASDDRLDAGAPVYIPLPGTPLGGLWIAFLRDPDGVTVELVERPVDVTPASPA